MKAISLQTSLRRGVASKHARAGLYSRTDAGRKLAGQARDLFPYGNEAAHFAREKGRLIPKCVRIAE